MVKKLNIRHLILDVGHNLEEEGRDTRRIKVNFMDYPRVTQELYSFFDCEKVDCVISLHSIEHLAKESGFSLLKQVELWSSKLIIFETPNGFVSQGAVGGNVYQIHLSGWSWSEFCNLGYQVKGSGGLKILKKDSDKGAYKLQFRGIRFLDALLSRLFFLRKNSNLAFNLIAFKVLDN